MYLHPPVQDGENVKAKHQEIKSLLQKCSFFANKLDYYPSFLLTY